jgi:death-on-curing protein
VIKIESVLQIHGILIEEFGGANGIRDQNGLESALYRPYSTYDGNDLYPTPVDKAAAFIESIVKNHPFIDGNKRTGYTLMRLTLLNNNYDIEATQQEKYEFVIKIAKGLMNIDDIKGWINDKLVEL